MAKSIKFYSGTDSFGRCVEVAQRLDGVWFSRAEKSTRFGNQMEKWSEHGEPTFETHGINEYTGDSFKYKEPQMFWGFNKINEVEWIGARLPNTNMREKTL